MTKPYDDSNWREEYKNYTSSKYELDLLENGPKSLSQSWMMGALHNKWKKMKGYKEPEPPDVSSSLKIGNLVVQDLYTPSSFSIYYVMLPSSMTEKDCGVHSQADLTHTY